MAKKIVPQHGVTPPLSQTPGGVEWLGQFDLIDQAAAKLLLDSVILVDAVEFERGLKTALKSVPASPRGAVTAMFAIREMPKPTVRQFEEPTKPFWQNNPSYFDLDSSSKQPDAVGRGKGIGSEGAMANLVRDLCGLLGPATHLDHPSIDLMRNQRCSRVVLLDDILASGDRAVEFVSAFYNHPTIRSWISSKFLSLSVAAYAGTERAIERLEKHPRVESVHVYRRISFGSPHWKSAERAECIAVCEKYASRTRKRDFALGYQDMCTLIAFHHKCPNNAPAILWAAGRRWKPMFNRRPGLGDASWSFAPSEADRSRRQFARYVGSSASSGGDRAASHFGPGERMRLLVLSLCRRRIRRPERLSMVAEVPAGEIGGLLKELRQLGWLDSTNRPTEAGIAQLEHAKRFVRPTYTRPPLIGLPYYPRQLRGSQRPV